MLAVNSDQEVRSSGRVHKAVSYRPARPERIKIIHYVMPYHAAADSRGGSTSPEERTHLTAGAATTSSSRRRRRSCSCYCH